MTIRHMWRKISVEEEEYWPLVDQVLLDHIRRQRQSGVHSQALPDHDEVLTAYTNGSGDYSLVNTALRDPESFRTTFPHKQDKVNYMIRHLDELMEKAPQLSDNTVLYRGIKDGPTARRLRAARVGDSFKDLGYMSTSASWLVGDYFAAPTSRYGPAGVTMHIEVPKGIRALHTLGFVTDDESIYEDHTREAELLLRRNTHMKVMPPTEDMDENSIRLRVVKQPPLDSLK